MNVIQSIYKNPQEWDCRFGWFEHKKGFKVYISSSYGVDKHALWTKKFYRKFIKAVQWWSDNYPIDGNWENVERPRGVL